MDKRIERVIAALHKNNMEGIYLPSINDIVGTVKNMLFDGCVITAGGSVSLKESGVWDLINRDCYNFLDRTRAGITEAEKQEAFKASIGADFFFCSTNALTENGELINVDGFANRISAISFAPKKVILVVGANKIVKDINEGFLRVKKIAAPKNCERLNIDAPCRKLGHCVSLLKTDTPAITDGCDYDRRICRTYQITSKQPANNRITVLICGENLGY